MSPSDGRVIRFFMWAVAAFAVGTSVFRAATQSITHDEALTYLLFMQGSFRHVFSYTGNQNHVLQALLSRSAIAILPTTPFTLRLPTVLASVVYCAIAVKISARWLTGGPQKVVAIALLTLNPYVLDFLSAARGYGLMLAFVFSAVYLLVSTASGWRGAIAGALLGLAVAATTVSIYPAVGILFACATYPLLTEQSTRGLKDAVLIGTSIVLVAIVPLANQLSHASRSDYYIGATSPILWFASLIHASIHQTPAIDSMAALGTLEVAAVAVIAFVLLTALAFAARCIARRRCASMNERALVWLGLAMIGMAGFAVALHAVIGLRYPQGRTALYWIPVITLAGLLAFEHAPTRGPIRAILWSVIIGVLTAYVVCFQVSTYADWKYDAADEAFVARLTVEHAGSDSLIRVGGSWQLEPSINFYRLTQRLAWMAPMERIPPARGYDYYVFFGDDREFLQQFHLKTLLTSEKAESVLATPQ